MIKTCMLQIFALFLAIKGGAKIDHETPGKRRFRAVEKLTT